MTDNTPIRTDIQGPYGSLEYIPYEKTRPEDQAHVCAYLITSPPWHPVWDQYFLAVVSLSPFEGVPDANLQFEGATHELLVMALNPDNRQTKETMVEHGKHGTLPHLLPVNIAHQFEATDEEMEELAWLCGRTVIHGGLNPETGDAPERIRETWLSACVKTLAHMRGEVHSS